MLTIFKTFEYIFFTAFITEEAGAFGFAIISSTAFLLQASPKFQI
jgi:hypothetical protein